MDHGEEFGEYGTRLEECRIPMKGCEVLCCVAD